MKTELFFCKIIANSANSMQPGCKRFLFSCDKFSCGVTSDHKIPDSDMHHYIRPQSRKKSFRIRWLTLIIWIFGFVKVLLVRSYHQAFECPRRGRLRLKDFSSRCDVGVEVGVFFRLRAITWFLYFWKILKLFGFWPFVLKPAPVPPMLQFVNPSPRPDWQKKVVKLLGLYQDQIEITSYWIKSIYLRCKFFISAL